eukprot:356555-Hanusia_phi.AAC.3
MDADPHGLFDFLENIDSVQESHKSTGRGNRSIASGSEIMTKGGIYIRKCEANRTAGNSESSTW